MAKRVLLIKADNSLLIFSELGSYKPLNWMAAPCTIREVTPKDTVASHTDTVVEKFTEEVTENVVEDNGGEIAEEAAETASEVAAEDDVESGTEAAPEKVFRVAAQKSNDILEVTIQHIYSDETYDLGEDPGLVKDGVEDHLQHYLAQQIERIGEGAKLVRREYPTPIGPVDIMAIDGDGQHVAIEIKRHGGIDGVEQLTRYCKLLNKDPLIAPVRGMFAAQTITPQARVLAQERGFECLILDYDEMKGTDDDSLRLF